MKNSMIVFAAVLLSMGAFADVHYQCYNLKKNSTNQAVSLRIGTGLISQKITSVNLVSKIKANKFDETVNPFTVLGLSASRLDEEAVAEATDLTFKQVSKKSKYSITTISLSGSLLNSQDNGFAHYYAKSCFWVLDCFESYEYFKCDKI